MSFDIASTWDMSPPPDVGLSVVQSTNYDKIKRKIDDLRTERKNSVSIKTSVRPYNAFREKMPKNTSTETPLVVESK